MLEQRAGGFMYENSVWLIERELPESMLCIVGREGMETGLVCSGGRMQSGLFYLCSFRLAHVVGSFSDERLKK